MDSKFINSQTMDYLKAKQGSTMQQQINNIKDRLNLEVDEFATALQEERNDMLKRTGDLSAEIMNLQYSSTILRDDIANDLLTHRAVTDEAIENSLKLINRLQIGLIIALAGVVGCLIKLLI